MKVTIQIERCIEMPIPYEQALALMRDMENSIRLFPKLRKLSKVGEAGLLWEMDAIGSRIANIQHEVSFAADFQTRLEQGLVEWKALPKHGNASIDGCWTMKDRGGQTQMSFRVSGQLHEVPVPFMYRLVAPAFIQAKFAAMVERFLEKIAAEAGVVKAA